VGVGAGVGEDVSDTNGPGEDPANPGTLGPFPLSDCTKIRATINTDINVAAILTTVIVNFLFNAPAGGTAAGGGLYACPYR
jgi:hypothetical protein